MDKRTTGIIATLITVVVCGCPGLFALCMGAMFAVISFIPGADININGSSDPKDALTFGVVAICAGIIFVLIPTIVGFRYPAEEKDLRTGTFQRANTSGKLTIISPGIVVINRECNFDMFRWLCHLNISKLPLILTSLHNLCRQVVAAELWHQVYPLGPRSHLFDQFQGNAHPLLG